MNAMIDVRCEKCRKRFGWQGDLTSRPPCPGCGFRPDPAELRAAQDRLDEDHRLMSLHPGKATADELRRQRVMAGLTLHQAAGEIGVPARTLADFENQRATPNATEAAAMARAYGCGEGWAVGGNTNQESR